MRHRRRFYACAAPDGSAETLVGFPSQPGWRLDNGGGVACAGAPIRGIDTALARQFESDHFDTYAKRQSPDQRTLCGHVDAAAAGQEIWDWGPYYPGGAVQGKVTDSQMAAHMSLIAHLGHPCGAPFYAKPFLAAHPQYQWMAPVLRDMPAYPWTTFASSKQPQRRRRVPRLFG